jgi:CBS domain-containing protein
MVKKMRVKNFMARELITFTPDMNVYAAINTLIKHQISGAPVVDRDGNVVGMLSEIDCMHTILEASYYNTPGALVGDLMSTEVSTVEADMSIVSLAEKFINNRYRRYPVVEKGKLVGLISRRDVLRAIQKIHQEGKEGTQ